ncbi:hypothetical protein GQ600_17505 [Phytophthora cactorum]|nr:hypothetical protein GQ600_17505 [Phytophthora cactorum]
MTAERDLARFLYETGRRPFLGQYECAALYQGVLRDSELRQLEGPTYVYALWNTPFAVSVQVSSDRREEYGHYGRILRSWWVVFRVTYGEYLPDLMLRTLSTMRRYVCAFFEAIVTMWNRCYAFGEGGYWIALIGLSLCFFVPMAVFDSLEFVLGGTKGVVIVMVTLNALNSVLEDFVALPNLSGDVRSWSVLSLLALLGLETDPTEVVPSALTYSAMDSVQKNVSAHDQAGRASWGRLRAPEVEVSPSVPTVDLEAHSIDPTLEHGDAYYLDAEESRAGMPADFSSAEVSFVHALRALQNWPKFSIRRRRMSGRGDCPVSVNNSAVPGVLPPHSIATAPAGAAFTTVEPDYRA